MSVAGFLRTDLGFAVDSVNSVSSRGKRPTMTE